MIHIIKNRQCAALEGGGGQGGSDPQIDFAPPPPPTYPQQTKTPLGPLLGRKS